ncbi:MAG: SGNH/GDSL hydrolase family protein [Saprospiraceae bacterium]
MSEQRSLSRRILFGLISILLLLLIIGIVGEIGFRIFYAVKDISIEKPEAAPPYNTAQKEDKIGWRPKSNYLFDGKMKDTDNIKYDVHLTTNESGFRQYGNPKSDKTKVFFLGDSYTQSVEVSDDKTFYKILGDSLPIEVFAYGMAGYGQLQQYMILEEFYEEVQPDILVLQVCSNDFIDNHHLVELESGYKVGLRRPYLNLDGEIEYHHPIPTWKKVEKYSRFLGFIMQKFHNAQQNVGAKDSAEKKIAEQGRTYEAFDYSVKVTELALQKIIEKCGDKTQILVFNTFPYGHQGAAFKSMCEDNNILYTSSPADSIKVKEHNSITVRAKDGYHWNEPGHEVIAKALMEDLKVFLKKD